MLFRRRKPASFLERARAFVWPRKGALRSFRYMGLRIVRIRATPHAIATGIAAGVVSSCTPFIGLHFIIAFALAWLLGGNMIAAALGTTFGNPLSFPLLWGASYRIGHAMLGSEGAHDAATLDMVTLFEHLEFRELWAPVLKPMLVGGLPLGLVFGALFYAGTRYGVQLFQARQHLRRNLPGV